MSPFRKDISVTLILKIALLFLLWYTCVSGRKPERLNGDDWFFGKNTVSSYVQSISTEKSV